MSFLLVIIQLRSGTATWVSRRPAHSKGIYYKYFCHTGKSTSFADLLLQVPRSFSAVGYLRSADLLEDESFGG